MNGPRPVISVRTVHATAACGRNPVVCGHFETVFDELEKDYELEDVKLLEEAPEFARSAAPLPAPIRLRQMPQETGRCT
ncbi:hypothetical protein J2TS6_10860 [Paenibacillus albilobatus]|uniref:Uncharacterized protein n=1 Tax=Paenibacillus albilobatus TaxID=2716884 RepID=A0A919XG64_9BACL|nr:hypothetical protein J2TS6_10860 [Paenibacillus albilobatus]